ncbi:MAG: pyridoxamine 5'-phosphate oxidase family protein [Firmicutes bacterium]|nr:pyridoxamine 5'-phosphate oxidase family protein [Bacillota bacterium]
MRQMRRFKQILSDEDCRDILERGTHGVMAIMADDDFPYAVPINYYYDHEKQKIYFHGANKGMRWDYMMERPKVSFCVVDMDQNDPENYSTNFRSAICYGTARVVEEEEEYYDALVKLTTKFVKGVHTAEEIVKQIDIERAQCGVTAIDIEFITGKEAIELVQAKKGMEK